MDDVTQDRSSQINSEVFRDILCAQIQPNAAKLIGRRFILQMGNDPKHKPKAAQEFIKAKKWNILEWPSPCRIPSLPLEPAACMERLPERREERERRRKVIRTGGKGMSCIMSAVSSSVQSGCFIFGEQQAVFDKVDPEEDMLLMLRFYHWPGGSTAWAPWQYRKSLQPLLATEEWAVAWTVVGLTRRGADGYGEMFEPYGGARIKLYMFSTIPPDFPFPDETPIADDEDGSVLPEGVYLHHSRSVPPAESYRPNDTIRLFVDGARFLPDAVTVTRVTGRIFDRNYDQIGPDICTGIDLTSDIVHPSYNYTVEINSPIIAPTATLLLKVYTVDRFTRDPALIGWAAINLFVESCSLVAPKSDTGDFQVSVNEGAHQIRVYHLPPPTDQAFSVESLTSSGRIVPCATLLLRIMKAGTTTTTMERPEYSQGVYLSSTAHPTAGETQLYRAMGNRSMVRVREVIPLLASSSAQGLVTDKLLSDWVYKTFAEIKEAPRPFQLCCVSPYLVKSGMKVSVDAAQNLPWLGFTFAHVCFSPPAAYYYGHPWMRYDRATTVHDIDLSSDQRCPVWQDGFMTFTRRIFHKHLTIIIHLHEIVTQESEVNVSGSEQTRPEVSSQRSVPVFRPVSQAWTALGVFYKSYCNLGVYQLPLYQGAPSQAVLRALLSGNCREKLQELEEKNTVVRLAAASVIVRIADGRRQEEVTTYNPQDVNRTYLPEDAIASYTAQPSGRSVAELVPGTQQPDAFKSLLVRWYRKYVTEAATDQFSSGSQSEPLTPPKQ
ncbi:unnamed protein product [Ranitomeya imitator]|uniref:Uncharacterized protein n=1 Tax=Ranitomeya imitator TaxID=111125 RepID=A0ABN9LXX8_9NEOB|nr:unnamed protein product [Ranitomeya imitator]